MAENREITKEEVKKIEKLLFKYKKIPLMISKLMLEIEIIEHTYDTLKGKSDNEIMPGSATFQNSSSVENEVISKEHRIEKIKEEITQLEFEKRAIDISLNNLTEVELGIIQDKYFNGMPYSKLGDKHYFTKEWAYYTCQRIIKDKLAPFIVMLS